MQHLPHSPLIQAELGHLNRLCFSPAIEARFETERLNHHKRIGRITLLFGLTIFDAFLFADWQILPDMLDWLAFLRLGVFTPLGLLVLWALPRTSAVRQVDAMAVAGTLLAVFLPMTASVFSQSPYVLIYQFGSMITITYFTLVQRVRFRPAVVGLAAAVAIQLVCVALRPEIDTPSYLFVINFYLAGALLLLVGSFVLERGERQGFLEHLRTEFLIEHIERTARTDWLTGLFNRNHLAEIGESLATGKPDAPIAALMVDIDHFKRFNDTQGHLAGDCCIRTVAEIIRQAVEDDGGDDAGQSLAFRFGGEEFLVLLPGWGETQAAALGEAIRRRVEAARIPHPAMGQGAQVTVSLGVAASRKGDVSLDELIGLADTALYRAKHEGRNRLATASRPTAFA